MEIMHRICPLAAASILSFLSFTQANARETVTSAVTNCEVIDYNADAQTMANVRKNGVVLAFNGPSVNLTAVVRCSSTAGRPVRVGWVQFVDGWILRRQYGHGEIVIDAPHAPIWDGYLAPYPWYDHGYKTLDGGERLVATVSLVDSPGGRAPLVAWAKKRDEGAHQTPLLKVHDENWFTSALVAQDVTTNELRVLGITRWHRQLVLAVSHSTSERPQVEVQSEWIKLPADLDKSQLAIESYRIPDSPKLNFTKAQFATWISQDPLYVSPLRMVAAGSGRAQ
ncbi:MAG TPA: hypothetical protein PLJ16_14600 [Casimicrobium huifangae]|jgi:hypothetical protein|nr:hypothetical protein [Casimicrobium huifangae]